MRPTHTSYSGLLGACQYSVFNFLLSAWVNIINVIIIIILYIIYSNGVFKHLFLCMFLFSFIFCYVIAFPTWLSFCVCTRRLGCTTPTPDSLLVDKHDPLSAFPPIHNMRGAERSLETVLRRRTPLLMVVSMSPDPSAPSVPV